VHEVRSTEVERHGLVGLAEILGLDARHGRQSGPDDRPRQRRQAAAYGACQAPALSPQADQSPSTPIGASWPVGTIAQSEQDLTTDAAGRTIEDPLSDIPEAVGNLTADHFEWTLYAFEVEQPAAVCGQGAPGSGR
jgi:hypothetical protein